MSSSSHTNGTAVDSIITSHGASAHFPWSAYAIVPFVVFCLVQILRPARVPAIQSVTPKTLFGRGDWKARQEFMRDAAKIIRDGFSAVGHHKPFRVIADVGDMVILPPSVANDIRNDNKLSFVEFVGQQFHKSLPGFEPFEKGISDHIFIKAVRINLTQQIGKIIPPLMSEAGHAVKDIFTDEEDWHEVVLRGTLLTLVSRMSSRVFLGAEICRNVAWLNIIKQYVMDSVPAVEQLSSFPPFVRRIVHWVLPRCRKVRAHIQAANDIIWPVIKKRQAEKAALLQQGKEAIQYNDAIEWFEEQAMGAKYDPAIKQIALAIAAVHTTTDLLTQTMFQILQHPEIIQPLRDEMYSVFSEGPLQKTSMYRLKLLDSVLKESQRLKPSFILSMNRVAMKDTRLPDGTFIPKGTKLGVSLHNLWDGSVYENPEVWDPYRFLKLRERPGQENAWQLATTSPEHLAFGHGLHSCPGRFMATNELKIALCHMLLKYDWKLAPGVVPRVIAKGTALHADPMARVLLRRRQAEVDL
ncbi:cytochrome protein [Tothia fuscella]|uniref:Cytochrome protein n=1 Tax=Tothia fuscella TaxID=1048955 RepID=A0A9P4NGB5_9PEZI|nr:cytochrome protein [Tothia fuscella]